MGSLIISTLISIIIGVFCPIFLTFFFELTPGEQVIIGITSFFIWPIIKIQYFIQLLFDEKKKKDLRIEQTNDFDYKLTKISTNYNELLNSSISEIANEHVCDEINEFYNCMDEITKKQEFVGYVRYVVDTNYILKCFGNSKRKEWFFTWVVDSFDNPIPNNDNAWSTYLIKALSLLKKNEIQQIDIIFILIDKIEESQITAQKNELQSYIKSLLKEYSSYGLSIKAIKGTTFDSNYKSKFPNNTVFRDFGIYSNNLLFIYDLYDDRKGTYCMNAEKICKYTTLFNNLWDTANEFVYSKDKDSIEINVF